MRWFLMSDGEIIGQSSDPVKRPCEYCLRYFDDDGIDLRPNPYHLELEGDDTEYWICNDCWQKWADDI